MEGRSYTESARGQGKSRAATEPPETPAPCRSCIAGGSAPVEGRSAAAADAATQRRVPIRTSVVRGAARGRGDTARDQRSRPDARATRRRGLDRAKWIPAWGQFTPTGRAAQ